MASSRYTEADFERAMRFVAWLIELYGDAYWPVFDWLEEELEIRRARTAKLKRYAGAQGSPAAKRGSRLRSASLMSFKVDKPQPHTREPSVW